MSDRHTQNQYDTFSRLTPYSMAWVLMRRLSLHTSNEWRVFEYRAGEGKGTNGLAAHAIRRWMQYDIAYRMTRKLVRILAPFASPDDPDVSIMVKSELDENRLELEGIHRD